MPSADLHTAGRPLPSFGRRRGRRLRPAKQALIDGLLPQIELKLEEVARWRGGEVSELFAPRHPATAPLHHLWLEIGFGGGEHLAHQAALHRDVGLIGCEPYINGIAALLARLCDEKIENVRLWQEDARLVIDKLPDACLSRVFILYPDPWPKARHHKRRLISTALLDELARVMKPGAQLRLATDHPEYCAWMLERLLTHPHFQWQAKDCDSWLKSPPDWIPTRYEQKRLAGQPTYLNFTRR